MKIARGIVAVLTTIALAVSFVAAGFAVCILPPVTHTLSSWFAKDAISPFDRTQLVEVADATRDFSFGAHDEADLYRVIYLVDVEYQQSLLDTGGTVPSDFPKLDRVTDRSSLPQLKSAFAGASELYCYSENTVSHLDDCYKIMAVAFPILVVVAAIALVGLVFTGVAGNKRLVGVVLIAAGVVVMVSFVGLGVWAGVDFAGFFRTFHQLFFSQGNWEFPYDSLLICALPTEFWMGMGVVWLGVAIIVSILSIVIGKGLRK
ncbi:MAG: DUF1461 domain-containing protein [Eggerthellaceae bacterium]|nr:DUF1461 domain-containing protein [Eggerthellaceae bacterium]